MIKQFTLRFAVVMAMLIATRSAIAADFTDGIFSFDIISEEEATVKLVKAAKPTTTNEMYLPSTVKYMDKTYTVKVIGERAINGISGLQLAIYIPNTIDEIEPYGISSCWEMYWLEIYEGDTPLKVGKGVLNSCSKLEYVDIRRQIVYADDVSNSMKMFYGKKQLYGVQLQGSYTSVNDYEFAYCTKLEYVTTSSNVTKIGNYAFDGCTSYSLGIFDFENVTEIGEYAFSNTGCTYVTLPVNVKIVSAGLFSNCSTLRRFSFSYEGAPEVIGKNAFIGCAALESFTVPSSITEIGVRAFEKCTSLTNFTIEPSDTEIKFVANGSNTTFFDSSPLETLTIGRNIETYVNEKSSTPFAGISTLKTVTFNGDCNLIQSSLFYGCTGLTTINWDSDISEIKYSAFSGCTSLVGTLRFPETLKKIGSNAFNGCTGITYIDFPSSIESIGTASFSGLSMNILNIPSNVKVIWENAFASCPNLKECHFANGETPICLDNNIFRNSPLNTVTLARPFAPFSEATGFWNEKTRYPFKENTTIERVLIDNECTNIPSYLFYGCSNLKSFEYVDLWGAKLESIGDFAFYNCSSLTEICIAPSVIEIDDFVFNGCSSLKKIGFAQTTTPVTLGYANNNKGLFALNPLEEVSVSRPLLYDTAYDKGRSPFCGLSSITHAQISDEVGNIDDFLFAECSGLTYITLPQSLKSIGKFAFYNCTNLKSFSFGDNLQTIGSKAFVGCPIINISSLSATAPQIEDDLIVFDESVFTSALLKVPEHSDAIQSYVHANVWKNFYNIASQVSDDLYIHSITLDKTQIFLKPTETSQIVATILPEDAGNKILNWASSDDGVVSVSEDGKITANKSGVATITATATDGTNLSVSCEVVVSLQVAGIVLNETEATLNEGQTVQLIATVSPELADNKTLNWTSSNEAVATVDQSGLVTALAQGSAVITVSSTDGSDISATCNINVRKLVSDIVLNEAEATLNEGQTVQLTATVSPELADNKTLNWTSSNEAVATVDQSGLVTDISQGSAVITAESTDGSNISATCNITVIRLIASITLSETEIEMSAGEYRILTAAVVPNNATTTTLIWSSSNESVARVENGIVMAIADGEATITASANDGSDVSASCNVIVRTLVTEIILSENNISLKEGEFKEITATVFPDNATVSEVTWDSSDESVATVQNGLILAHKLGSAVIRVEATDGSGVYAECTVYVTDGAGIADVTADGISIITEPFIATVHGANEDTIIRLFDMSGKMLYQGNDPRVEVAQSGVYILFVNSKTFKIKL